MNPLDALNMIRNLMKESGKLFVEVPNIFNIPLTAGLNYFFRTSHVFYFSPATLNMCLQHCGFKPIKWDESPKGGIMVLCEKETSMQYSSSHTDEAKRILLYLRKYRRQYYTFLVRNPSRLLKTTLLRILTLLNIDERARQVYQKTARLFR